jgi:hypothetical protein
MTIKAWVLDRFFSQEVDERVRNAVKVVDDAYWRQATDARPLVRPWYEVRSEIEKLAKVYAENPLASRLISMTTDFVIGEGAQVSGDPWASEFWNHPLNRLDTRIYRWCNELSKMGELSLVLSRNPVDGMSYVRELPAIIIDKIETDPEDLENELRYHQLTEDTAGRWWSGPQDAEADQVVLHYTINRPVGMIRGVSDLSQVLTWLERYDLWLEDRVRINRYKGAYLWHVKIAGALPGTLEAKRAQYARVPKPGSIIITDDSEEWAAIQPKIGADDVEADGKAIRLMIAAGVGVPLHFLAEGESATRATAREMGTATYRHFAHRQHIFGGIVTDVIKKAAQRAGRPGLVVEIAFESVLREAERIGSEAPRESQKDQG